MDFVLHQAAIPSVPRSVKDPVASNRANVDGTLQRARRGARRRRQAAGLRRLVVGLRRHADAAQARGHADRRRCRRTRCRSSSASSTARSSRRSTGCETVTTRYFNVFGPRQDPASPYSGVIPLFATALLEGRAPTIYGDGAQTRDFTYVANVVDGVLRACDAPAASGEVINVATGGRVSLNDLLANDERHRRHRSACRSTSRARARRRPRFAGRHQRRRQRCSAIVRSSAARPACG